MYSDPLAYFLTWTTYGTWLPGDARGSMRRPGTYLAPDFDIREAAREKLCEVSCTLTEGQREIVELTIVAHCQFRKWHLYAANCRTNHVHVVVTAPIDPKTVRGQLKSWCSRRLSEAQDAEGTRKNWWSERGSVRLLFDDRAVEEAIAYVTNQ